MILVTMSLAEQIYLADMDPGDISSSPSDLSAIMSLYGCLNKNACYAQFHIAEGTIDYFYSVAVAGYFV